MIRPLRVYSADRRRYRDHHRLGGQPNTLRVIRKGREISNRGTEQNLRFNRPRETLQGRRNRDRANYRLTDDNPNHYMSTPSSKGTTCRMQIL